jgi:hypothetical protein
MIYHDARSAKRKNTLCMFRTVFSSIIRSLRLYIQHQVCVKQVLWLLASGNKVQIVAQTSHLQRVTTPDALFIQFNLLRMSIILLETCRGL